MLAIVAAAVTLTAQIPKQRIAEAVAGRLLHAEVSLSGLRLRPDLRIASLRISDPGHTTPVLEARDIAATYRLAWPGPGRRIIEAVTVDAVHVRLHDAADGGNHGFITALLSAPPKDEPADPLPWIPRSITVEHATLDLQQPGVALLLDGISARVQIDDLANYTAAIAADGLSGHLTTLSPPVNERFRDGAVEVTAAASGNEWRVDIARFDVPGLVHARAAVNLYRDGDATRVVASIPSASAGPLPVEPLARFLGLPPARFEALHIENGALDLRRSAAGWQADEARADAAFSQLEVGDAGARWYAGDLSLHAALQEDDTPAVGLRAVLGGGQKLEALIRQEGTGIRGTASLSGWTKADVAQSVPEAYQPLFAHVTTLERLSATAEVYLAGAAYEGSLTATARLGKEDASIEAAARGTLNDANGITLDGAARAALAGGALTLEATQHPGQAPATRIALENVRVGPWMQAVWGTPVPELPAATLNGTATIGGALDALDVSLDIAATDAVWGTLRLDEGAVLDLDGDLTVQVSERLLAADALTVIIGPELTATISDGRLSLLDYSASAQVDGEIDLAWAGAWLGQPDLWGDATFSAPLRNEGGYLRASFHAEAPSLGYGNLTIPYGSTLVADGRAVYDTLKSELRGEALTATIGEGTRLTTRPWTVRLGSLRGEVPFELTSDFVPIVAMGYLQDAEGTIEARGALHLAETAHIEAEVKAAAAHFTLPGAIALVTGATFDGRAGYGPALSGEGMLTAESTVVAGAIIGGLSGPVRLEGDTVVAAGLTGTLFDGPLTVDASAGLLREKLPFTLDARGTGLDLALLVEQVKPPRVTLTGPADATLHLELDQEGLQEVKVTSQSTGALTVNRDIIQQVLLSQYVQGVTGGRQLDRVVRDVLGTADQRPFDSGALDLDLVDGRLEGQAVLTSGALNLTIDLHVDPEALVAAMQLTQQEQFRNIQGVTPGPIEWDD